MEELILGRRKTDGGGGGGGRGMRVLENVMRGGMSEGKKRGRVVK